MCQNGSVTYISLPAALTSKPKYDIKPLTFAAVRRWFQNSEETSRNSTMMIVTRVAKRLLHINYQAERQIYSSKGIRNNTVNTITHKYCIAANYYVVNFCKLSSEFDTIDLMFLPLQLQWLS